MKYLFVFLVVAPLSIFCQSMNINYMFATTNSTTKCYDVIISVNCGSYQCNVEVYNGIEQEIIPVFGMGNHTIQANICFPRKATNYNDILYCYLPGFLPDGCTVTIEGRK